MTLATRCSRCSTVFRLDQASLSAAEGWVRCGRCREVFNAVESLFESKSAAPRPEFGTTTADATDDEARSTSRDHAITVFDVADAEDTPPPEPIDSIEAPAPIDQTAPDTTNPVGPSTRARAAPQDDMTAAPDAAPDALPVAASTIRTAPADEDDARDLRAARVALFGPDKQFDDDSRYDTQVGDDGLERMSLWSDTRPSPPRRRTRRARPKAAVHRDDRDFELSETTVDVASAPMPSGEAVDNLLASNDRDTTFADYEPASGYEIPTRPVHRRPTARLALRITAIVLGVGLALQSVLHARDSIAVHWPSTEPALQRLCAAFGCEVEAPRDLQALQVQSVTFQEAGAAGQYGLNVVLFNRSDLRVRMPALDLRISDARGAVAARRVLTAAELEQRERSIAPRSEATLQANLRIDQPNVSGYEVTVFYP